MLSGLFIMLLDNGNINGMDILWFSIAIIAMHVRAEGCDTGWREFDGMCYFFSSERVSSPDIAQSNCLGINGVLAAANTMEVNNYLHQTILNTGHHWIGLVGMSSPHNKTIWHWLDGSAVDTNIPWAWDEPTGNSVCGKIGVTTQKKLGYDACTKSLRFICESDEYVSGWLKNGGHWYRFHSQSKNFISAMRACADENAYLANIGNTDEFEYITANIGTTNGNDVQQHWVGLTTLHWLDGSPITWINFKTSTGITGSNACVYLHSDENKWESNCNPDTGSVPKYICQKAKSTSATAIPDTITNPPTKPRTNPPSTQTTHVDASKSKAVDGHQTTTVNLSDGNIGRQEMIIMGNSDMPVIAGAVAAIVVVLVVIIVVVALFLRRRKRSQNGASHSEENHNKSSANDDSQEVEDIQPYESFEKDNLNHKQESEDISPYYNSHDAKSVLAQTTNMQISSNETHSGTTESEANINSMPIYAVVDVPKKRAAIAQGRNTDHQRGKSNGGSNKSASGDIDDKQRKIKDKQIQQANQNINLINALNNAPVYAVVDKTKKLQSSKPIPPAKPSSKPTQNTDVGGISANIYNDCENEDDIGGGPQQIQYAELDIQEEPSESNKLSYNAGYKYAEVQFKD